MFELELPLPPTLNEYLIPSRRGSQILKGASAKSYQQTVWYEFRKRYKGARGIVGAVGIDVIFHMLSVSDIDNRLKSLLDSLQGLAYENDRQVERLTVQKIVVRTRKELLAIVRIFPLEAS